MFHESAWICLCIRPLFDLQQLKIRRRGLWRCVLQIHALGIQMMSEAYDGNVFFPPALKVILWALWTNGGKESFQASYLREISKATCLLICR